MDNPDQINDKVYFVRLELKAGAELVTKEEERVQDIREIEVKEMSSDEHH